MTAVRINFAIIFATTGMMITLILYSMLLLVRLFIYYLHQSYFQTEYDHH